jgi:zinc protease
VYTGKPSWLAEDLARYRAVTPAQVQAAAAKYLTQSSRVLMTISPKKEAAK